jgi:hypothetical protein
VNYEVYLRPRQRFIKESGPLWRMTKRRGCLFLLDTPHYGGLWEAGFKLAKDYLKRAFHTHTLTFEEFSTSLAEIEACMNSRPLCPLTSAPEDLNVLTLAHFLKGVSSDIVSDTASLQTQTDHLGRFQLLQRIRNHFWRKWRPSTSKTYRNAKNGVFSTDNIRVGQLVLLRDDRSSPAKRPLGRIVEVHATNHGLVRVVTVKTAGEDCDLVGECVHLYWPN